MDRDRVIRNWDGEEGLPAGKVPARAGTPDAYLLKRPGRDELLAAIRQVLSGGSPMSSQIARKVVQAFHQPAQVENDTGNLSVREQEALALLAKGFLYKEIATQINIGYDTVHNYIRRINEELRVRSGGQAVAEYFEQYQRPSVVPNGK